MGIPVLCPSLITGGPSGLSLVSSANIFDVPQAGDMAFLFFLTCQ